MHAKVTKAFRIAVEGTSDSRKYCPGEVAEGAHADWAVENGYGAEIEAPEAASDAEAPAKKRTSRKKAAAKA